MRTLTFFLLITGIAFGSLSLHVISYDEGMVLGPAWNLWQGKTMYVDWVEYVSPGSAYLVFWLWKILGTASFASAKILAICIWLISALGIYFLARRLMSGTAAEWAVLLWLLFGWIDGLLILNHNFWSTATAIWFTIALLQAHTRRNPSSYYLCGALAGATFLLLQTKGLAMLGVAVMTASYVGGARKVVIGFLPAVLLLSMKWDPQLLWSMLFVYPVQNGYLAHTIWSWPVFFVAVAGTVGIFLLARRAEAPANFIILGMVQLALLIGSFNLMDIHRLLLISFPMMIAFVWLLWRTEWVHKHARAMHPLAVASAAVAATVIFMPRIWPQTAYANERAGRFGDGIFGSVEMMRAKNIFAGPFVPGLYFETRKPDPFPVSNLILCDANCHRDMLKKFKEVGPEIALLADDGLGYNWDNPLMNHIRKNYLGCPTRSYPDIQVYAKSPDMCPRQ